jgi:phosphoglycolate phosphatase
LRCLTASTRLLSSGPTATQKTYHQLSEQFVTDDQSTWLNPPKFRALPGVAILSGCTDMGKGVGAESVPKYKLVIFDFDGTLADTFPWFKLVLNGVAKKFHFKTVDAEETDLLRGKSARELLQYLGIPRWKLPFIARHMRLLMAKDIEMVRLFSGADHMLRRLSESGMTLAVVSSNAEHNVRFVLGTDASTLVRYYACGASMFGKSAKFRTILRKSGLRPGDAIYIGDEIRDFESANQEGLSFGAVAWGYTRAETLAALPPRFMFMSLDEIANKLL